jgi:hypothetical protein
VSSRRRVTVPPRQSRANDRKSSGATVELAPLLQRLQETIAEIQGDVLMLTRKIVAIEAEIDYIQGKRTLR